MTPIWAELVNGELNLILDYEIEFKGACMLPICEIASKKFLWNFVNYLRI